MVLSKKAECKNQCKKFLWDDISEELNVEGPSIKSAQQWNHVKSNIKAIINIIKSLFSGSIVHIKKF